MVIMEFTTRRSATTTLYQYTTTPGTINTSPLFQNFTNAHSIDPPSLKIREWLIIVAFVSILVSGVTGNLLVCYLFGIKKKSKIRSTTELLILYLGVIDLMTSLFNPILYIYFTSTHYRKWHFGDFGCKLLPALGPIMTTASGGVLLIFTIDRFLAIVTPFRKLSARSIHVTMIVNMTLSFLTYLHYILQLKVFPLNHEYQICSVKNVKSLEYGVPNCTLIIFRLLMFTIIFGTTTTMILITLKRHERLSTVGEFKSLRHKQSKRIMKVLITMGIVFIVLVYPRELFYLIYNLSWLVGAKKGMKFSPATLEINSWLKVFHTANSCANVFIYAHMQTVYRRHVLKVLKVFGCFKTSVSRTDSFASKSVVNSPQTTRATRRSKMLLTKTKRSALSYKAIGGASKGIYTPPSYHVVNNSCNLESNFKDSGASTISSSSSNERTFFMRAQIWKNKTCYHDAMYV